MHDENSFQSFAKILKNECDEDFRSIQVHVKETLLSLVKVMIKDKYPLKSELEVQRLLDNIQKGRIEDWMWQKIIERMYDDSDADALVQKIAENIASK